MTDEAAVGALCSDAPLVVLEAPAGCGKTFQGAACAAYFAAQVVDGRVLVLTHTHAAADVFARRLAAHGQKVSIRTIDSLIVEVAAIYHIPLELPKDPAVWARNRPDGYRALAEKLNRLLQRNSMIAAALAARYPVIICDEHQDASVPQEAVIRAMIRDGVTARILGDPMQAIYRERKEVAVGVTWKQLRARADRVVELGTPHRWLPGARSLGEWILAARADLREGRQIDLTVAPREVRIVRGDNKSPVYGGFRLDSAAAAPLRKAAQPQPTLILAARNRTVESVRAFLGRRIPIWEGHTRKHLEGLVEATKNADGSAPAVCEAFIRFMAKVATGFTLSRFGRRLTSEVERGCSGHVRGQTPTALRQVARCILEQPNHVGVANGLRVVASHGAFKGVQIDCPTEYWDAIRIGQFADADEGMAALARTRSYSRIAMPTRAISTIHKAKGLECDNVVVVACDALHFPGDQRSRCLLYVAISRAKRSLTLHVPSTNPSPLLRMT